MRLIAKHIKANPLNGMEYDECYNKTHRIQNSEGISQYFSHPAKLTKTWSKNLLIIGNDFFD